MKFLTCISLVAFLFGFKAVADDTDKPQVQAAEQAEMATPSADAAAPDAQKPCPFKEAMKKMKNTYWSTFLTNAGLDASTIEKVLTSMQEMMKEEHAKYKELRMQFKADALKRLTDAGVTPEKAAELMATFHEKVNKPLREAIKAAMMEFVKDRVPEALETPKSEAAEQAMPAKNDAAPAQ